MADIGALIVKIGADASGLEKAFTQLTGSAQQFQKGLDTISSSMQAGFFAAVSAAAAMTVAAAHTAEETDHLAQKTGIAADAIEGMTVLMNQEGLTSLSLTQAMRGLSKEIVGVQEGTATSVKLFQDMGVSLDVVERGTGATLRAIADRFKEMPDGANKARLAVELFGRAGLEWIPILNKGSAAMDEAMKKSAEFGLILTETARTNLTTFDHALEDMFSALKGFGMQVGIAFAPTATALVQAFTTIIVHAKDIFNQFADAASVLAIRIGAMIASAQLLSQTLFSLSVFSKAAWEQTLNQVKAIDAWAASEIKGVSAAREEEKTLADLSIKHLEAKQSVEAHAASQKILGEQIVAVTRIQLHQIEEMGKHQERMGSDIVSGARVTLAVEASEGKRQEHLGKRVQEEYDVSQKIAQDWVDAYDIVEAASQKRFQMEMDAIDHNQEYQGKFIVMQAVEAQNATSFWVRSMDQMERAGKNAFGHIRVAFGNAIVGMIKGTSTFSQFITTMSDTILNAGVQLGLNLFLDWAKEQFKKVAVTQATNATIVASNAATATATTSIWGAATVTINGLWATTLAGFESMIGTMVATITAVGEFVIGVLSAIATALTDTIFGIPWAGAIVAGIAVIAAALAATGNLGFSEGGIGDFGSGTPATLHGPEAIIPLNQQGASFMREAFGGTAENSQVIHTHVYLDRRQIALAVSDGQPAAFRTMGVL